ncbi:MAG TPA: hypothetical protein VK892_19635, partial [Pyrinomonadaceae bacterium]|nr:hypothetical protein [Pyrinomonadaceae bacterium]
KDSPEETDFEQPEDARHSWAEWLGTDEAIRWISLIFGFCATVLVMIWLQFSTQAICCGDWDGYYHIRWSWVLWESFKQGNWLPEFSWLPLTVLNPKDYADHHFLFHLLQIPFLWFFEPVTAAKVAAVVFASLAIFSVYWLMFRYQIDYLLVWFFALLGCASSFLFRMNMAKAPPLTIIYTVVGIYLLFERKYIWLMPLMFLFVWTYSLFPLLFIAAIIWAIIIGWNERKFEWQPIVYTFAGMVLGNIINPYFPQNIGLFVEHFWTKFKVGSDFVVSVGGEWYPYSGMELLLNFPIALMAMLMGYILFMPRNGKLPEKATFFLMFTTILLAAQFRSKRFAEYFPPFAILFAAFSWQAFRTPFAAQLPEYFRRDIEPFLDREKDEERQRLHAILKQAAAVVLGFFLVIWIFYNLRGIEVGGFKETGLLDTIRGNEANNRYERSMAWAAENIPPGERIFNANWDDFPKLFFYNQKHSYVYGLDPNYLYTENPELSKLTSDLTGGKIEDPAPVIREKFGANYIFNDARENADMIAHALESGWVEIIYEDDEAQILKIREQKGEPPSDAVDDQTPLTPEEIKEIEEEEKAANANQIPNVNEEDGESSEQ